MSAAGLGRYVQAGAGQRKKRPEKKWPGQERLLVDSRVRRIKTLNVSINRLSHRVLPCEARPPEANMGKMAVTCPGEGGMGLIHPLIIAKG